MSAGCTPSKESSNPVSRLHVFAASSLTEAFQALEVAYESKHPEVEIALNLSGSQILRTQIQNGAQAHVFASANPLHVQALQEASLVNQQEIFAYNRLALLIPHNNPGKLQDLKDLPKVRRLVVGNEHTPIGQYTRDMMKKASLDFGPNFKDRVWGQVVSEEPNARLLRSKVEMGAVDAAVVYESDTITAQDTKTVSIPEEYNVEAEFTLATLATSRHSNAADSFFEFVLSQEGQELLKEHGFIGLDKS